MRRNNSRAIYKMVTLAMLAALGVVLMAIVRFPLIPSAPFLEYDMGDVPVLIATLMFGPLEGLLCLLVVSLLQTLTVSSAMGWIGFIMHMISSGVFLLAAGLIYKKIKSLKGLIAGLICGAVAMTLVMIPLNILLTPIYMGAPRQEVINMLIPAIIPFNAAKGAISSAVTAILFIPLSKILKKSGLYIE